LEKYIKDQWILSELIYRFYDKTIFKRINEENINIEEVARQYIKK